MALFKELPEELNLEITKRMTVKTLVRCTLVCKTWLNQIKNPFFILTQLQMALPNPTLTHIAHLVNYDVNEVGHIDSFQLFDGFNRLDQPFNHPWLDFTFIGASHGLVCLFTDSFELMLWNPSIRKYMLLPKSNSLLLKSKGSRPFFGFGFDPNTLDFKVVLLITKSDVEQGSFEVEANVFSLQANSWNRVMSTLPKFALQLNAPSVYVNGIVHWMGYGEDTVFGFDISTEKFINIGLPQDLVGNAYLIQYLESSIAVVKRYSGADNREELDLWVMKEYNVVGSWIKVTHLPEMDGMLPVVKGFWKDGEECLLEVLVQGSGFRLASHLVNSKQLKYVGIVVDVAIADVASYVENLVLLDKGIRYEQ